MNWAPTRLLQLKLSIELLIFYLVTMWWSVALHLRDDEAHPREKNMEMFIRCPKRWSHFHFFPTIIMWKCVIYTGWSTLYHCPLSGLFFLFGLILLKNNRIGPDRAHPLHFTRPQLMLLPVLLLPVLLQYLPYIVRRVNTIINKSTYSDCTLSVIQWSLISLILCQPGRDKFSHASLH